MAVSELGMQALLLQGFQRAQGSAETHQLQLSSGKEFQTYGEYGADALRLISAEGVFTRANAYENASEVALSRHELIGASIETVAAAVEDSRAGFVRTLATGSAELLLPELETAAQRIISALNVELGGVYLFGGVDGTVRPVGLSSLGDIGSAADLDDVFNEGARASLAVEEGVNIDGGPVASEIARRLFGELQELANAEAALGPFIGNLTDAQRAFIIDKNAAFTEIADELYQTLGFSAVAQGQAADAVNRNVARRDLAEIVSAEIEDADIAEALSRLNQDQIAIQASAQALARATELSLLNFI
ncbi:MAG: hypothetical protein HKN14_14290 [Marinicaulis sp.]|nr:hypothetical protein [Marinicaulis sp.]NNE42076.1 hypothetical protein [Marinicaulis sp.]